MKYNVMCFDGSFEVKFESNSRNAKQHAINHGAKVVEVRTKSGKPLSRVEYSEEFGYNYTNF